MANLERQHPILDFWYALLALATLIGAYLAAASLGATWSFWAITSLACVYAIIRYAYPQAKIAIGRIRKYPKLEHAAAVYKAEIEDLKAELLDSDKNSCSKLSEGISIGRGRVIGEYLAGLSGATLTLDSMYVKDNKTLLMVAEINPPNAPVPIDTMWQLRIKAVGTIIAHIKVEAVYEDNSMALLTVATETDSDYVGKLIDRAKMLNEIPAVLEIASRSFQTIEDLKEEDN